MKHRSAVIVLIAVFTITLFLNQPTYAQSSSVSNNVTLQHLNVQLTYPAQVLPGESITVNVQAKAKDSFRLNSLTLQVYLANSSSLVQLTSATVAQDQSMTTGGQINKDVQVTVPADAPRTSLVAVVSENVRMTYYYYNYWAPYWYGYDNYSWPYFWAYPSYYYRTVTDNAIAPLTYIKATTPEYVTLQSQYQQLQQMLNQTQAQNKELQQNLQNAQNTIAQRDSTIAGLNEQLASLQSTITLLEAVVVILAVAFIVAGVVAFLLRRGKARVREEPEEAEIKKE
jgi:hypothetical protein